MKMFCRAHAIAVEDRMTLDLMILCVRAVTRLRSNPVTVTHKQHTILATVRGSSPHDPPSDTTQSCAKNNQILISPSHISIARVLTTLQASCLQAAFIAGHKSMRSKTMSWESPGIRNKYPPHAPHTCTLEHAYSHVCTQTYVLHLLSMRVLDGRSFE